MADPTGDLNELREKNPEVDHTMEVFRRIDSVYQTSLQAMGLIRRARGDVSSSAEVMISFRSDAPSSVGRRPGK